MEDIIRTFFARYERLFAQALAGEAEMEEVAALYAPEFIAASPAGVKAGRNDDQLRQAMAQGYAHYGAIGTKKDDDPRDPAVADGRAALRGPCRLDGPL